MSGVSRVSVHTLENMGASDAPPKNMAEMSRDYYQAAHIGRGSRMGTEPFTTRLLKQYALGGRSY